VVLRFLHASAQGGLRVDVQVVDAIVNGVARTALAWGAILRLLQTGIVTHYAAAMIGGVVAGIALYWLVWAS
jgi:multicomponent Na+:H+ antiporter subunit D